jgi:hypothetical protein
MKLIDITGTWTNDHGVLQVVPEKEDSTIFFTDEQIREQMQKQGFEGGYYVTRVIPKSACLEMEPRTIDFESKNFLQL